MQLLNFLQSDWCHQHSDDVHENLSKVAGLSPPTRTMNVWPVRLGRGNSQVSITLPKHGSTAAFS